MSQGHHRVGQLFGVGLTGIEPTISSLLISASERVTTPLLPIYSDKQIFQKIASFGWDNQLHLATRKQLSFDLNISTPPLELESELILVILWINVYLWSTSQKQLTQAGTFDLNKFAYRHSSCPTNPTLYI